jgi:hypothetical protein
MDMEYLLRPAMFYLLAALELDTPVSGLVKGDFGLKGCWEVLSRMVDFSDRFERGTAEQSNNWFFLWWGVRGGGVSGPPAAESRALSLFIFSMFGNR